MVFILPFLGAAALLSGLASALPRPEDSAIGNEVGVSAPNGIVMSDTAELSSQLATATQSAPQTAPPAQITGAPYGGGSESNKNYGSGEPSKYPGGSEPSKQEGGSESNKGGNKNEPSWSTPSYGSGSSNWGNSGGYNDCVSQCMAKYGAPVAYKPTETSGGSEGSKGTGATHTVIVAPTQGVLRYIPFAVNASVGDTIKFMWGANNHTVTKSSALQPCNKTGDALFTSGSQNKDFVFTQVVNDTKPTFFYCNTPSHCQKGMFGIINPSNAFGTPSSFAAMVQGLSASNPDVATYASITKKNAGNNTAAANWGGNMDLSQLPAWSHSLVAENVLFTRNFLASNPEVLKDDGSIDLSTSASTPLMIPQDVAAALSSAAPSGAPINAAPSPSAPTTSSAVPTSTPESQFNSASSLASPRALVGLVVVVATFFAL